MIIENFITSLIFAKNKMQMKLISTIFAVLIVTTILLTSNSYLSSIQLNLNQNEFVNGLLKYQLLALCISIVVLIATLKITPDSRSLLKIGNLETLAVKEKWLGINGKTSWKSNAIQFALFISLATGIFMFLAVKYTGSLPNFKWSFLPLILLISFTNSFSEEIIYRFAINGNLTSAAPKLTVLIISAILFGIPHYLGFPSGVMGVLMSGALGYILSKATYETKGIGIAWAIHFLQDIIIFTGLIMMNIKI